MEQFCVGNPPHIRHDDTVKSLVLDVLIALIPALVWGIYVFGFRALILTLVSILSCTLCEVLFCLACKIKAPTDLSSVLTGVIFAMLLPVSTPYYIVPMGAAFAMVAVKGLFGGLGRNFLNPALGARAFLVLSFPLYAHRFTVPFAHLSLFGLKNAEVKEALANDAFWQNLSLSELFTGSHPGGIGEGSALLLLAGFVYLLVKKVVTWHLPLGFLSSFALLTFFLTPEENALFATVKALLSGSTLLIALFCASDPVTSPLRRLSRLFYGVLCGVLCALISHLQNQDAALFATLTASLFTPLFDRIFLPRPCALKNERLV